MNESMKIIQVRSDDEKSSSRKKIVKSQIKKLIIIKISKTSKSIRALSEESRFDIRTLMNLSMTMLVSQLLNEASQLRRKLAFNLQSKVSKYRVKRVVKSIARNESKATMKTLSVVMIVSSSVNTQALENDEEVQSIFLTT